MVARRRAVLTGCGLITPIGLGRDAFWGSLCAGKSGIRSITSFDASNLPTRFGGEVIGFDAREFLDKKERKRLGMMARTIQFAVAAAQLAMSDAGASRDALVPVRFGVEFGASVIPTDLIDLADAAEASVDKVAETVDLERWGDPGISRIPPMWLLTHVPNMMASHVSILHNAQGPNNTITQTDAGALLGLGEALRTIQRNVADIFLVGGADTQIVPLSLVRHCLFAPLSRRNDNPAVASRPFDRWRDGVVPGEGAGVVVLEELEHAQRRGARIYAEVVGFAAAFDADRSGRGLAQAIKRALSEAGITAADIDHVNAHGRSTIADDAWEARGLHEVFADHDTPIFAAKSYIGSLGAGGGTAELAASLLAMSHGILPATLNYEEPDPACPVSVVRTARAVRRPYFLKVSLADMGQCAAVVCRKME